MARKKRSDSLQQQLAVAGRPDDYWKPPESVPLTEQQMQIWWEWIPVRDEWTQFDLTFLARLCILESITREYERQLQESLPELPSAMMVNNYTKLCTAAAQIITKLKLVSGRSDPRTLNRRTITEVVQVAAPEADDGLIPK